MKAKYFSSGSVLCQGPSFDWRSIFSSRDLLKVRLIWRTGGEKEVKIWNDKWLPTPTTYSVQSPRIILSKDAKVKELIDQDTKCWKTSLINDIFMADEAEKICQLPLSMYIQEDKLIWRGTNSGEFTVWSAYHKKKERKDLGQGEGSTSSRCSKIWKIIWSLKVPNLTFKVFLWQACNNLLPTKKNLLKIGIVRDSLCIFCNLECESVTHILWSCPSASDVCKGL